MTTQTNLPEVLYGQIMYNGCPKVGQFRLQNNKWTNKLDYHYYSPKGNRGKGGFTISRAKVLMERGHLSTNPEMGQPENYL